MKVREREINRKKKIQKRYLGEMLDRYGKKKFIRKRRWNDEKCK